MNEDEAQRKLNDWAVETILYARLASYPRFSSETIAELMDIEGLRATEVHLSIYHQIMKEHGRDVQVRVFTAAMIRKVLEFVHKTPLEAL